MVRTSGIGNKSIVHDGENSKIGIRPKKIPTSTKARIPMATVAIIGKYSRLTLVDNTIVELPVKLTNPPDVPRAKI